MKKLQRLDLATLSERTGIEHDRLRRFHELGLVPERTWLLQADDERLLDGIDELTGTFLVCATLLHDAGFNESKIAAILRDVCRIMKQGRNPLRLPVAADIVGGAASAVVQISDGNHIRWKVDGQDSGWIQIGTSKAQMNPDHAPKIVTALDMSAIHEKVVWGSAKS